MAAILVPYLGTVVPLGGTDLGSTHDPGTLQALAVLLLDLFNNGFSLALTFFGVHLALLGALHYRSPQVPRILAALVATGVVGCAIDSLSLFPVPGLHTTIALFFVALPMV